MNAPTKVDQLKPEPLHRPFTWLSDSLKGNHEAEFLAQVKTLCTGVTTLIEVIHDNNQRISNAEAPLLSEFAADALLMLAGATTNMLAIAAEDNIDFLYKRAEGRAA